MIGLLRSSHSEFAAVFSALMRVLLWAQTLALVWAFRVPPQQTRRLERRRISDEPCSRTSCSRPFEALGWRRDVVVRRSEPTVEDRLALGGDVGSLFLYSYMQKVLDSLFAIASTVSDAVVTTDKMDAFQDPSFAASALSIAWLAAALPMGGFDFRASRSGVSKALVTVARLPQVAKRWPPTTQFDSTVDLRRHAHHGAGCVDAKYDHR